MIQLANDLFGIIEIEPTSLTDGVRPWHPDLITRANRPVVIIDQADQLVMGDPIRLTVRGEWMIIHQLPAGSVTTSVYPASSLLGTADDHAADYLQELVLEVVAPESWDDEGTAIDTYNNLLWVTNRADALSEVWNVISQQDAEVLVQHGVDNCWC